MKSVIFYCIIVMSGVSCVTTVAEKKSGGSVEKLASDVSEPLNGSRMGDIENRMLEEMKFSGIVGVFLINKRGETVRGYVFAANGEIVSYRGDFKGLLLSNDDEIEEALVFYQDKMLGMVRIVRNKKQK